ncbi:MAG: Crp/Fnr family transcriptional regulator [Nitrospirae bacterium]|nr:Crp/Fnr family transcriptional regulator [Nitrospirota bacterium]NTW65312.1 Crp/Fnr family transcriptional regulator [Nitrospirota bacterium]
MNPLTKKEFQQYFPFFRTCPDAMVDDMLSSMSHHHFRKGQMVFLENDACTVLAFLLSGDIRVYMLGEEGREITLYDVLQGETCILNVACILSSTPYPARAMVIEEGDAYLISAGDFRRFVDRYAEMRTFVYAGLGGRLISMMRLVEEVAFRRLDERLRHYLAEKNEDGVLNTTHQKIANELGTSREIISRLLGELERKGVVSLSRNRIEVLTL